MAWSTGLAAVDARARDVVRRQVPLLTSADARESLEVTLAVFEPSATSLATLNAAARVGLQRRDSEAALDIAHELLDHFPALGIMFSRAALDPRRSIDSSYLLDEIEEARDRLGLPPGDLAADSYDALLDQKADDEGRRKVVAELESEKRRAAEQTAELRQGLRDAARNLEELQVQLARAQATASKPAVPAAPELSDVSVVRQRLREKIEDLKGRVADGQRERAELRRKLEQAIVVKPAPATVPEPPAATPDDPSETDAGLAAAERNRVRVPVFADRARAALGELPRTVAARGMVLIGELAAGQPDAWESIKRLQGVPDLLSARVGIHHRILFRLPGGTDELEIVAFVSREDQPKTLRLLR